MTLVTAVNISKKDRTSITKDYNSVIKHNYEVKLQYQVQSRLYLEWMKVGHYKKSDGAIASEPKSFVEKIKFKITEINCQLL